MSPPPPKSTEPVSAKPAPPSDSPSDWSGGSPGTPILRRGELAEGKSRKFNLECGGREVECFVVNFAGALHAYVNRCRHVSMSLDWVENQFFTEDSDLLLCPTHGALYLPDTGECIAGPPCGKALCRVPLAEQDDQVFARCPEDLPD